MKPIHLLIALLALFASGCQVGPITFNPPTSTPTAPPAATQRPGSPSPVASASAAASASATRPITGTVTPVTATPALTRTVTASPVVTRTAVVTTTVRPTGTVTTAVATRSPTGTATAGDAGDPVNATVNYVLQSTQIRGFDVSLDALTTDWARATVRPKSGDSPSVVYLKKTGNAWSVVSFGAANPANAGSLGIPSSIIGEAAPPVSGSPTATGTPTR